MPEEILPFKSKRILFLSAIILGLLGSAYIVGLRHGSKLIRTVNIQPGQELLQEQVPVGQLKETNKVVNAIGPETIADIAASVSPSVVNIDVLSHANDIVALSDQDFFFNGNRVAPFRGSIALPKMEKSGIGSGLIIRSDGYILTNYHVVKDVDKITVTLADHRSFIGKIIGRDSLSDLAVVKIPATNLPVAVLGSSKNLRPGEWAIAIGNPLGLDQTVTLGIISAVGRSVTDVNSEVGFIQTDAAINPGNSGGPLLDLEGEVIGINSFIRSDAQKIGFATPIDVARSVSEQLIVNGKIDRAWIGMKLANISPEINRRYSVQEGTTGVVIVSVVENGPAALAGIQKGDIIQKIQGRTISLIQDAKNVIGKCKPDQKITVQILRDGQKQDVEVLLTEMPSDVD